MPLVKSTLGRRKSFVVLAAVVDGVASLLDNEEMSFCKSLSCSSKSSLRDFIKKKLPILSIELPAGADEMVD